jgi:anti-anti-sigma factor
MQVKIDTKEKFHVIRIQERVLTANMTEELRAGLLTYLQSDCKNVVLNLTDIIYVDDAAAETLINIQQSFYDSDASFVICNLHQQVEASLDSTGLLEIMNVVPSESEAGDIVQMEEIERELLEEDEP